MSVRSNAGSSRAKEPSARFVVVPSRSPEALVAWKVNCPAARSAPWSVVVPVIVARPPVTATWAVAAAS